MRRGMCEGMCTVELEMSGIRSECSVEICSIYVKISWDIKKTKARPSASPEAAAPLGVVFFISHDIFT